LVALAELLDECLPLRLGLVLDREAPLARTEVQLGVVRKPRTVHRIQKRLVVNNGSFRPPSAETLYFLGRLAIGICEEAVQRGFSSLGNFRDSGDMSIITWLADHLRAETGR
jgi:hypothetical protein